MTSLRWAGALTLVVALAVPLAGCSSSNETTPTHPSSSPRSTSTSAVTDGSTGGATGSSATPTTGVGAGTGSGTGSGSDATPTPVPSDQADGWTDDTAYTACRSAAIASSGSGYTWGTRSSQAMVYSRGLRTIDVAGQLVNTGGEVTSVTFRCNVQGTPAEPNVTGGVVH